MSFAFFSQRVRFIIFLNRKEKEILNGKEILDFAIISESDQKRFNSLMQKINLLDFSIQRIDSMILLMEKF